MGVPVFYIGSKYKPTPLVPIPVPTAPHFSSAEVGDVNASTVAVTFDSAIVADGSDYSSGVTIKVNGSTRNFESGIRQANHAVVYYALSSPVANGDTVTWEYSGGSIISESDGLALANVSAQNVTNNVAPSGPQFASAEIGTVNASTVVVTFDRNMSASDYAAGATIKVNGSTTIISAGIREADHKVISYAIPVLWHGSGDSVTWEYNSATGNLVAESGGAALGDVSAQAVTNNCEYAALLDLQADTLALNDGDPVSTWADQSGNSRDFTQTGDARPSYSYNSGNPFVYFDGNSKWMEVSALKSAAFDNLSSFAVFMSFINTGEVARASGNVLIGKINNIGSGAGWLCGAAGTNTMLTQESGGSVYSYLSDNIPIPTNSFTYTALFTDRNDFSLYINGVKPDQTMHIAAVADMSNAETLRLGTDALDSGDSFSIMSPGYCLIYAPPPNGANRAALEARLAARYGITL